MATVSFQKQSHSDAASKGHHTTIGHKVHKLLHPNGKTTHVAASPEEAHKLRSALAADGDAEVEVVVRGSPEHTDTLRRIHTHCDGRRAALREQHGELFDELEHLRAQMDEVAAQLEAVEEQEVALDANFSKYGYSAAIRTHEHSPTRSSASSTSSKSLEKIYQERSHQGAAMRFFRTPIVRQYHHKGLLWRATEAEEVSAYELFFDLIYVGIIAISGDSTAMEANGTGLLRFAITYLMGWKIWSDVIQFVSWFQAEDIFRRLNVLLILILLLGMTTNIYGFSGETFTPAVAFFIAARLVTAISYILYAWLLPMVRPVLFGQTAIVFIVVALWIGAIQVEGSGRQALVWIALILDIFANGLIMFFKRWVQRLQPGRFESLLDFIPAINIEHRIERTNAFVSLVFGYSVVSLLYQSAVKDPIDTYFGKATLGLIQAFTFAGLYFEMDSFNLHTHAIRRHFVSSSLWLTLHIPFTLSFVLAGAALSRIVLTHDTDGIEQLADISAERSAAVIPSGLRWFYCTGLGVALLCMSAIAETHEYRTIGHAGSASRWLTKRVRHCVRCIIGIVLICLSVVQTLNSLQLIATTTSLAASALAMELFANTYLCEHPERADRHKCQYTARCRISRKDLEEGVKDGTIATVSELKGEKGSASLT